MEPQSSHFNLGHQSWVRPMEFPGKALRVKTATLLFQPCLQTPIQAKHLQLLQSFLRLPGSHIFPHPGPLPFADSKEIISYFLDTVSIDEA